MLDLKSLIPWRKSHEIPVYKEGEAERRWQSVEGDALARLRSGFQSLLDDFLTAVTGHREQDFLPAAESPPPAATWRFGLPIVDVVDREKELVLTAELPGVSEKDVEITLAGDVLTIRGEKNYDHEEREGNRYYVERRYGSFSRSIRLPFSADQVEPRAEFDKGVLKITIPKPADYAPKVRHLEVKAAA